MTGPTIKDMTSHMAVTWEDNRIKGLPCGRAPWPRSPHRLPCGDRRVAQLRSPHHLPCGAAPRPRSPHHLPFGDRRVAQPGGHAHHVAYLVATAVWRSPAATLTTSLNPRQIGRLENGTCMTTNIGY